MNITSSHTTNEGRFTRFGLAALVSLTCGGLALAQSPSSTPATPPPDAAITLPPVTVTAETPLRTSEDLLNLPQSITVIEHEDLIRRQPRTPIEALQEEPGIWAVSVAAQGSPIIRGQLGNRNLYLWDGVRINNAAGFGGPSPFFNQFPIGALDRVEVIRGSGSVQYGSDAIGGVLNLIPRRASFSDTVNVGGELYGRYGSNDDEFTETLDVHATGPTLAFSAGITRQDVDDYKGPGEGTLSPTGYEATGGYANLAFRPAEGHTFRLSWIHNRRDDVETYVQSKLNANGVPRIFTPDETRGIVKFDYTAENLGSWSDELRVYGYYHYYDQLSERRRQNDTNFSNTKTTTDQEVLGVGVQNAVSFEKHSVRLIYGVDYRYEMLDSSISQSIYDYASGNTSVVEPYGNVPDGTYDVFDAFATFEFRPTERLLLTVGARFENSHINSDPSQSDVIPDAGYDINDLSIDESWQSVTWNAGAIYNVTENWDLVANIGSGFRAPGYWDLLSAGTPTFSSRIAYLPSPNLDPEKSITYEFGPRYHSSRTNFSLVGFYTRLDDLIGSQTEGTVTLPGQGTFAATHEANIGEGYVTGAELALAYELADNWTFFGNATYTYGKDTASGYPPRFIPPFFGTVGLRYEHPSGRWWVEVVEVFSDRLRRHAPDDEQDAGFSKDPAYGSPNDTNNPPLRDDFSLPGWAITNVRGGVNVWREGDRALDLTLAFNNIFDTRYREAYAQRQKVAPGFGIVVGARLTF
ncbi:outer membrane receptor for ferrienterochelin and colicin [Roseimicrobium gellanilyticum]|uniref:Outer membrane receptor for ferrienterochelin and colicin n=1 Tax=Roseimicrobium gellanilyticum TaxID=748857 RepID=A0A366HTJ7_9BACT|nr:TonB-dependent receptor [Roseimicrobium gellanilyticum]RBP47611.1 outer membrane receptor for ferrienterochelin and colicin [Roseimicrobium gellanilyticum]